MQNGASYIKDSNDFMKKVNNINIHNNALLVTADFVGLFPSITVVYIGTVWCRHKKIEHEKF